MYFKAFSSFVNVVRLSVLDSSGDSCCFVEAATWLLLFFCFVIFLFLVFCFCFFFFLLRALGKQMLLAVSVCTYFKKKKKSQIHFFLTL